MSAQVRDMTKGSPAKLILLFAVPLMLGNIFQQLYTMVDTIVVGQVAGVQALAALGAGLADHVDDTWSFYRCYAGILNPDLAALWGKEME